MLQDYYSILGVEQDASIEEIKSAYRKLALKIHPDQNQGNILFEKMYRELKHAYEMLSDESRRREYDNKYMNQTEEDSPVNQRREPKSKSQRTSDIHSIKSLIADLRKSFEKAQKASKALNASRDLFGFLTKKIDNQTTLSLYQEASQNEKREFLFITISHLKFLNFKQRRITVKHLRIFTKNDPVNNIFLNKIIAVKIFGELTESAVAFILSTWWLMLMVIAVFILIVRNNHDPSQSTTPESSFNIGEGKIPVNTHDIFTEQASPSKYKGFQLKTGESPYNSYFGDGIFNSRLENKIKINNWQDTDVIICLTQYSYPHKTIRHAYIRAHQTFEMLNIPNGTYFLKSFYGKDWNPETIVPGTSGRLKGYFESNTGFEKSDNPEDLIRMTQTDGKYSFFEITLKPVVGGNLESEVIESSEFFN